MKALGVTDEDIVTSHISVYPSYRYDEKTDKQVLENYQAYTSVNVTTNDVDNAGKYVDAALNAGATGTNGVTFSLEKPETYYNQALTEAVKASPVLCYSHCTGLRANRWDRWYPLWKTAATHPPAIKK